MHYLDCLAVVETLSAERLGELTGKGIVLVFSLTGIIKCVQIMRRPTTSKICVSALLILLIGWFFTAIVQALLPGLGLSSDLIKGMLAFLGMMTVFVSLIIGIIGLATYDKTRFVQGRKQAIWSIVLSGLVFMIFIAGFVVGIITSMKQKNATLLSSSGSSKESATVTRSEFNFAITPPARWVQLKPETVNKLACVAMRRTNPEAYFMVIGERTGGNLTLDALKDISISNLNTSAKVLEQQEETVTLDGHTFAHVTSRVFLDSANANMNYEHWLATEQGFAWQCLFWAPDKSRGLLSGEARSMMETFKILDPDKDGRFMESVADVSRPDLGFSTKLAGMGWHAWAGTDEVGPLAAFSAMRTHEALMVVPLSFGQDETPDIEALTRGFLQILQINYPSDGDFESTPWTPSTTGEGVELTTEREVEGDRFKYVFHVARGKHSAHLVAGWALEDKGDFALVRKSLDAVTIQEPAGVIAPLNEAQKNARGILLNEIGLSYFQRKDFDQAATWFQKGFEQTKNDTAILENAGNAYEQAEKFEKGRDLLASQIRRFSKDFNLGIRFARLQMLSGDVDAGSATFLKLIGAGLKQEEELLDWLSLLNKHSYYTQAINAAEAWIEKHPSVTARRWLAQTLFLSGKEKESLTMFEKLLEENPKDTKVAYDLGSYYNDAGENAKAAAVAEKLLADGKDSWRALMILGWSQMGRKWYRDAKSTFELAANKQPNDESIQEAIGHAAAMLGQGDNSSIREPIELVAIPPSVSSVLAAQSIPPESSEGHSSLWLMRATGWHFENDKPLRKTLHRRVKIMSAEGARDFSSVEVGFHPLSERIYMNRLEVFDTEGVSVAKARVDDAYVRDQEGSSATNRKVLHMQVAGVQPGHVVEWEVTIEDRANSDAFDFQRMLFANSLPVVAEAVFVTGEISKIKAEVAQDKELKAVRSDQVLAWISAPRPSAPDEPNAIWPERRYPMLWLSGDIGSWKDIATDYLKQIEDRLKPDKSVEELSMKLTTGLTTDREKTVAIARHVQKEYGYKAIEFGVRARRPNAAAETVKLRYGDCKDFALLLHQLLRAAGVKSHLALVDTDWLVQPTLPSLDQFNHMVVNVPSFEKDWLLDATDKTLDIGSLRAAGLWQGHTLILDPSNPRLIPLPVAVPVGTCEIASKRMIVPLGTDWRVDETLTVHGYYAASIRDTFTGLNAEEQSQKAQHILAAQGAAQVEHFRFEHLADPAQPAILHLVYTVRDGIAGGRRSASVPALWERDYLQTTFIKDRRTAFQYLYPMHFTSDVTVKLPEGMATESLQNLKQEGQSDFCQWKLAPMASDKAGTSELGLHFEFTTKPGQHPASRYGESHNAWEAARRAWDRQISWAEK